MHMYVISLVDYLCLLPYFNLLYSPDAIVI